MQKVVKILFVSLSNIGDCILTLPTLDCLRFNFPEAEISVIAAPRTAEIFQESRSANKVFIYDKHAKLRSKIKLFKALSKNKFDLIVDLRNSVFSWLLPAARKSSRILTIPSGVKHMRERHLFKLSGLGLKIPRFEGSGLSLSPRLQDEEYISRVLKDAGIAEKDRVIAVSCGARSSIKRWPKEKFRDLIDRLPAECRIVLIGDRGDTKAGGYISRSSRNPVLDLTGKTSLLQAAALLKRAQLLITNDSANLHLASYLNVPTVAIFGPTDDLKYGPWSEKSRVVKKEIFCRPCMKAQCRYSNLSCLNFVKVEDVLRQVNEITGLRADNPVSSPSARYKRILIIRTDRMGDVILSTPAISVLREAYPQAYLSMVVRPYTKDIVADNPNLDEVFLYDKDKNEKGLLSAWNFSRALARKKFDLAVVLNPSTRSNLIPFLAGIPRRVGYDRKLGFLLTTRVKDRKFEGKKHEIEYTLDIVRAAGVEPVDADTFIPISFASETWAEEILTKENIQPEDRLVVLNPAASDDSKIWPPDRYAQVAEKLAQKGLKIVILGGPGDRKITGEVIKHMSCPYIDMVGNNNISQAASIIKRSSLFISSDTGPMHLASSLKVAVIAILGRSQPGLSPERWGPHNQNSLAIHKDVGCEECLPGNCPKNFLCLKAITADDVVSAAEKLLGR